MTMPTGYTFPLTRRDVLIALFIIALALVYRLQIIADRANAPAMVAAFDPIPTGTDQSVYYGSIAGFTDGTFPPGTFFFQPGMSYLLIGTSQLMRTANPGALRVFWAAMSAINCGVMVAVGWLLTNKKAVGWLAGFVLALYPVGAFYDTDFVIASQATILVTFILLGTGWTWRKPNNWAGVILVGLSLGVLALMRRELLALGPAAALWLLWKHRQPRTLAQIGVAAVVAFLVVLPVGLHNRAGGADYLITPVSDAEIYRGNNRDANGDYRTKQASATTKLNYLTYLWHDIMLSPRRFTELAFHKLGMYVSANEPGNNLSYVESGKTLSPVLAANPLDFRVLTALFLFGLWVMWRSNEKTASLLALCFLVMMATTLLIWVEARIRTPVIACMIPAAAYGIVAAAEALRNRARTVQVADLWALRTLSIPVLCIATVLVGGQWAENNLPRPVIAAELPADAVQSAALYDDTIRLLGWKIQEQYSPAGIIQPFSPYVVTFYWQLTKPTTTDYAFSLVHYIDGERIIAFDHPIGVVGWPEVPTSQWQAGEIHVEHVGLTWNSFDGPVEISGDLLLSVSKSGLPTQPLAAQGLAEAPTAVQIAQPAIIWGSGKLDTLPADGPSTAFGDKLILKAWQFPETVRPGEAVTITLGWQTTNQQIANSYSIGVYAFDEAGVVKAQTDSPLRGGRLLTNSLPINFSLEDHITLELPADEGMYSIRMAVYDLITQERLAVAGTDDNLATLGTISVQ